MPYRPGAFVEAESEVPIHARLNIAGGNLLGSSDHDQVGGKALYGGPDIAGYACKVPLPWNLAESASHGKKPRKLNLPSGSESSAKDKTQLPPFSGGRDGVVQPKFHQEIWTPLVASSFTG
jgi:hypothetical protein